MNRIGFLGLNEISESIVKEIYRNAPDTQVFIYPANCSRVQKLATEYPCWTLDDSQSVIEEAEIVILSEFHSELNIIYESLKLHSMHTLVSLVLDISINDLRVFFRHSDCVRMQIVNHEDNLKFIVIITDTNKKFQH